GEEGGAGVAGGGGGGGAFLRVEPRDIVTRQLFHGVERNYVPTIGLDARGSKSRDNAVNLLLVFTVDLRPEYVPRGLPIEFPVPLRHVLIEGPGDSKQIFDFRRQQIPVLVSYRGWRAFQVNVYPSVVLESITAL